MSSLTADCHSLDSYGEVVCGTVSSAKQHNRILTNIGTLYFVNYNDTTMYLHANNSCSTGACKGKT